MIVTFVGDGAGAGVNKIRVSPVGLAGISVVPVTVPPIGVATPFWISSGVRVPETLGVTEETGELVIPIPALRRSTVCGPAGVFTTVVVSAPLFATI